MTKMTEKPTKQSAPLTGTVELSEILAHPTKSLAAEDYLTGLRCECGERELEHGGDFGFYTDSADVTRCNACGAVVDTSKETRQ